MAKDYKFNKDEQIKCPICGESANYREFPDVMRLLESEKYRQMWDELKEIHGDGCITTYYVDETKGEAKVILRSTRLRKFMNEWQKYFPKEKTDAKWSL